MGMPDEGNTSTIRQKFKDLCLDLNMDTQTEEDAWETFERIIHNYTLEGDPQHWLACSLYVSCRKSTVPTVSGQEDVEGNCVSLTRLLRTTKLSLIDFFKKMKKWADMDSLNQTFRDKMDRLERNFAVSTVIFSKFEPIFTDIFITPSLPLSPNYSAAAADNPPKAAKGRKQKRTSVNVNEVFCFCWTTFVQVKGNYPLISDNLVNSYHLLLCCIDWIFGNILLSNRKDLLNPEFSGLPANYRLREYKPPTEPTCIINVLCEKHEGLSKEAKCIKEHYWKPYIKKHFEKKNLNGCMDHLSKVLDAEHFDKNCKSLNNIYEEYVLNIGDFDERIFLGEDSVAELGTPAATIGHQNINNLAEKIRSRRAVFEDAIQPCPLQQATPLSNRYYLSAKEDIFSPVSTATQTVSRLHKVLSGRKAGPSEELKKMFTGISKLNPVLNSDKKNLSNFLKNPSAYISKGVSEMGKVFYEKYCQEFSDDQSEGSANFARKIICLTESLYYMIMENVLNDTFKNHPEAEKLPRAALLLGHEDFHQSLYAMSLEIVNFSYKSQKVFPWVVEVLGIPVYSVVKVIELIQRNEKWLSREIVKHLNHVEEMILDSLMWRSDSALWSKLAETKKVPSVKEALLPNQLPNGQELNNRNIINNNNNNNVATNGLTIIPSTPQPSVHTNTIMIYSTIGSPISRPMHESFMSPVPVRRRLFEPCASLTPNNQENVFSIRAKTIVGKQITVQFSPTKRKNDERLDSVIGAPPAKKMDVPKEQKGSFSLILRKVYILACIRLRDLCDRLCLEQLQFNQIWTCIEHLLINHIDMLKDRHLDQIILCCIYAICRVQNKVKSFQDITRCYRQQPQANGYVYRSVLLGTYAAEPTGQETDGQSPVAVTARDGRRLRREREAEVNTKSNAPNVTPGGNVGGEDRGDLVMFYNAIFLKVMKSFTVKFSPNKEGHDDRIILSPVPAIRGFALSPRKVTSNIYVSPIGSHKDGKTTGSHGSAMANNRMFYSFNKSPSRDLQAINNMIKNSATNATPTNGKTNQTRLNMTTDQQNDQSADTRDFRRRLHQVVTERHAANGNA